MRIFLAALLLTISCVTAQAQNYLKAQSARFIGRTAFILTETHKEVAKLDSVKKDNKFALAVAHQRMARKCFEVADYRNAIYYSARARRLAVLVHSIYNPMFSHKFKDTAEENELVKNSPTDKVLDEQMIKANPGIKFNDNDYVGDTRLFKIDVEDLIQP